MKKYKLFIRRYSIMANDYVVDEREVLTNDIYHEIGKIYCRSIEEIKRIDYYEIKEDNKEDEHQERIDKAIQFINKYKFKGTETLEDRYLDDVLSCELIEILGGDNNER